MDIEITKQEKKPLLSRETIKAKLKYKGATPSRLQIRKDMAAKIKKDEKLVIIEKINTKFGKEEVEITANIYDNEQELNSTENQAIILKNLGKKKEKKEAEVPKKE